MRGLVAAFGLGVVVGGTGAAVASRLVHDDDVQARLDGVQVRLDEAHAQLTTLVGDLRAVVDEARIQLPGARATAGGRTGAAPGHDPEAAPAPAAGTGETAGV